MLINCKSTFFDLNSNIRHIKNSTSFKTRYKFHFVMGFLFFTQQQFLQKFFSER
jgi:hypothetical protein